MKMKRKYLLIICTFAIFCGLVKKASSLACYICDVTSPLGYEAANKGCNKRGPTSCQSPQKHACMIETYKQGPVYQVLKTCLPQCPVFVNTSATNVRCCMADGCNDFIPTPIASGIPMETGQEPMFGRQQPNRPRLRGPPPRRNYNDLEMPVDDSASQRRHTTTYILPIITTSVSPKPEPVEDGATKPSNVATRHRIKERRMASSGGHSNILTRVWLPCVLLLCRM